MLVTMAMRYGAHMTHNMVGGGSHPCPPPILFSTNTLV